MSPGRGATALRRNCEVGNGAGRRIPLAGGQTASNRQPEPALIHSGVAGIPLAVAIDAPPARSL